ncbi:MAG: hypothetical protein V4543_09430 [Bacteroidota bacterium]
MAAKSGPELAGLKIQEPNLAAGAVLTGAGRQASANRLSGHMQAKHNKNRAKAAVRPGNAAKVLPKKYRRSTKLSAGCIAVS